MSTAVPEAVLWDMDGTLVDTEPYWMECEFALARKYGGTWTRQHALHVVGGALLDSAAYMRRHMGIALTPHEIVEELLDGVVDLVRREVPWRPGARELLAELREEQVPCGLVTMSYRRFVEPVVDALPAHSFQALVCGDEVAHGKPHPEPYLRGADLLGLPPARTVAIEDSVTGTRSAESAGCQVLVVPSHVAVPPSAAHVQRTSLVGVRAADLADLAALR